MPVKLPRKTGLPERFRRHAALRELAREEAASKPSALLAMVTGKGGLSRREADARAKEMAKEPMPHTARYWKSHIEPDYE